MSGVLCTSGEGASAPFASHRNHRCTGGWLLGARCHCRRDAARHLIRQRAQWIGRSFDVAPRHSKRSVSQEVADQEGICTALGRKGPGGVAEIVWAKIGEACANPEVAPAGSEGRSLEMRVRLVSGHDVPPAHFNGR